MRILLCLWISMMSLSAVAQDTIPIAIFDSLPAINRDSMIADSIHKAELAAIRFHHAIEVAYYTSAYQHDTLPSVAHLDIEQERTVNDDRWLFYILLLMLIVITYLRIGFASEVESLIRSLSNSNISAQLFRSSRDAFSLFSILMNIIFILSMSLFIRMCWLHLYPSSALRETFSMLQLIFLFTLFFVSKYILLRIIGDVFDLRTYTDEYWFNYAAVCRSLGIATIPILFLGYALRGLFFDYIVIFSMGMIGVAVVVMVSRGLSTSFKLMYSSVYHFLIYVCVGEILPIFLLIKLLTKTAN